MKPKFPGAEVQTGLVPNTSVVIHARHALNKKDLLKENEENKRAAWNKSVYKHLSKAFKSVF